MDNFVELVVLATAMGLSIFLSLPIVRARRLSMSRVALLNAVAIGILVFLLADVFSDVAPLLTSSSTLYLTLFWPDVTFAAGVSAAYLVMLYLENYTARGRKGLSPVGTAALIAAAIGFQNLTEGLVFGNAWYLGEIGLVSVIFTGFFLQNVTEGFPIASPFFGGAPVGLGLLAGFFLIGGLPTIVGGVIGFFFVNSYLEIFFDALAIGAIAYCIVPMLKVAFRPEATAELSLHKQRIYYFGILLGFLLGFVVNAF